MPPAAPDDLAARPDPSLAWVAPLLLCLGVALRVALAFPTYKYQADADEILRGLCAFRIMRWEHPVFYVAERLGSVAGYLTALLFWIFGVSRASLAAGPVVTGALTLGVWYLFLQEALGRRLALFALPFAVFPSPAFLHWTTQPNTYPEIVFLCAAALWLAARLACGGRSPWTVCAFGVSVGLAWWASLLSLGCTFPALIWVAWRRRDLLRPRAAARFTAGFVLGALPWLAYNVRHPLNSLRGTALIRPSSGPAALLDNARFLAADNLRELIASVKNYELGPNPVTHALQKPVLAMVLLAVFATLMVFPLRRLGRGRQELEREAARPEVNALPLLALIAVLAPLLVIASVAGADRSVTVVRYLLPLYLIVPALLAPPLAALAARSRAAAAAGTAAILVFNLAAAPLPGTAKRQLLTARAVHDQQLLALLETQRVGAVAGSFWRVYPINFLSRERIRAIPMQQEDDYYRVAERLPASPLRWALVAANEQELSAWAAHAKLQGSSRCVAADYCVFLPDPNPPGASPAQFNLRLRAAYFQPPVPSP